tara:strand:+ start:2679 stop:3893 length:1215 start_codon:yes stop_codon:yes gene_type:complete
MGLFDNKKRPNGLLGNVSEEGLLALANSLYQQGQPSTTPRGGLNLAAPMLAYKQANKGNETDRFYLQLGIDPKNPQRDFLAKNILGKQMGIVGTPDQQNYYQALRTGFNGTFADYLQTKDDPTLMAQFMQGGNNQSQQQNAQINPNVGQQGQNNVVAPETPPKQENVEFFNYPRPNERVTDVDVANGVGTVYRNGVPEQVTLKGGKKDEQLKKLLQGGRDAINGFRPVSLAIKNIGEVLEKNPNAVGALSRAASFFPSDARSIRESLKTLQAFSGFRTLSDMKKASPNGGALGQVSERELEFLQATWVSLDPNLGAKEFKRRLDEFNIQLDSVVSSMSASMEESGITDPVAIGLINEMKNLSETYKNIGQASTGESEFDNVTEEMIRNMDSNKFARYQEYLQNK